MCGCGGGARKNKTIQVNQGKQIAQPRSVTPQRRCSRCSWPMSKIHRYDQARKAPRPIWSCLNRKCLHKEPA